MRKQKTKTLKLLILTPLLVVAALVIAPAAQAATPPDSCFDFFAGTGTINAYYDNEGNNSSNPACTKDVDIPSTIGGTSVTSVAYYAFNNKQLTTLTIPSSVTSISGYAFANNQLTSVTIPSSVTSIGNYAFSYNQLTSVTIPNSVTSIEEGTFMDNQLTSVTIPNSVTSIGDSAFDNNQLTSITIPSSVTSISDGAFQSNQLTNVTIPSSVTSIGDAAFLENQLTTVTIPNSVTSIGAGAFQDNQLTNVTIPNSVTSIDTGAFVGNKLTTVNIPNSVTSIGVAAFAVQSPLGAGWQIELMGGDPIRAQVFMGQAWYARLYTADPTNPNGLTDDSLTEAMWGTDFNDNGNQTDPIGGHLINPAQATLSYEDSSNDQLQADTVHTGTGLSDYLAASNPSNDFSLYYRLGSNQSFTPPTIAGFVAPGSASLTLNEPNTPHTFVYSASQSGSGGTEGSGGNDANDATSKDSAKDLASTGQNQNLIALSALILTLAPSAYLLQKSRLARRAKQLS